MKPFEKYADLKPTINDPLYVPPKEQLYAYFTESSQSHNSRVIAEHSIMVGSIRLTLPKPLHQIKMKTDYLRNNYMKEA